MEQNMNFNFHLPFMFKFLVFHKNSIIKNCSSFEDLSVYNISWSHINLSKSCVHLRSLNVSLLEWLKPMQVKSMALRSPSVA
jgi:hypothetical protein